MALVDILLFDDTGAVPGAIAVGSIVRAKDESKSLTVPGNKKLGIPKSNVGLAICVSLAPFTLVSVDGLMRWQASVTAANFESLGMASAAAIAVCNTRKDA
jgi:hypothetical protein